MSSDTIASQRISPDESSGSKVAVAELCDCESCECPKLKGTNEHKESKCVKCGESLI